MTFILFILLLLLGALAGFYSGLIGTGGNVILIPGLDMLFAHFNIHGTESVKYIIAHSLFITVFLGIAVSYKHYKMGNLYIKEAVKIGVPGMISAFVLSEIIKSSDWYDKSTFQIFFIAILLLLAIRLLLFKPKEQESDVSVKKKNESLYYIGLGLLTGCVTSLTGLGGGVVLIPFLTDILKISIKKASSISIGVIMLLAIASSISYLIAGDTHVIEAKLPMQIGFISMLVSLPILIGIFAASSYGVSVAQKTSPNKLRLIFGIVVSILCLKMILSLVL